MKKDKKNVAQISDDQSPNDLINPDETACQPEQARESREFNQQNISVYDFEVLAKGQRLVMIRLGVEVYTLQRTQANKLLLTK